jgi:hypothetical protein
MPTCASKRTDATKGQGELDGDIQAYVRGRSVLASSFPLVPAPEGGAPNEPILTDAEASFLASTLNAQLGAGAQPGRVNEADFQRVMALKDECVQGRADELEEYKDRACYGELCGGACTGLSAKFCKNGYFTLKKLGENEFKLAMGYDSDGESQPGCIVRYRNDDDPETNQITWSDNKGCKKDSECYSGTCCNDGGDSILSDDEKEFCKQGSPAHVEAPESRNAIRAYVPRQRFVAYIPCVPLTKVSARRGTVPHRSVIYPFAVTRVIKKRQ